VFIASGQSYVMTFAAATVPPMLALAWLCYSFRDELFRPSPETPQDEQMGTTSALLDPSASDLITRDGQKQLGWAQMAKALVTAFQAPYWQAMIVVAILYFGRFDFTFVSLRAQTVCANIHVNDYSKQKALSSAAL
jgi:hypothetical protein